MSMEGIILDKLVDVNGRNSQIKGCQDYDCIFDECEDTWEFASSTMKRRQVETSASSV
jgi:hypothetical protein